ncbi:MAG TPA: hypothetical protein VFQ61_14030 [Polyangiaceae bacterium]|nr:hypothetical protein [Polyangiaceae bacterium]
MGFLFSDIGYWRLGNCGAFVRSVGGSTAVGSRGVAQALLARLHLSPGVVREANQTFEFYGLLSSWGGRELAQPSVAQTVAKEANAHRN